MRQKKSQIIFAAIILVFLVLMARYGFTVVTIESAEEAVQGETFDPAVYVDDIWEEQLVPAFEANSVDLATILSKIETDSDGTTPKDSLAPIAKEYGLITVGEAHVYMVKGSGTITAVNTESSTGTVEVQLDGYQGPIKVLLYIGTRIPSDETSVRDAVGFISFGDFKEQTEYGKAASEINKRVISDVLGDIDKDNLIGKTIRFSGAFGIRTFNLLQIQMNEIRVVPMIIQLGE